MKILVVSFWTSAIFVFCIFTGKAQQQAISFSKYSSSNGLSSPTIYDILQDSYGFIWLATEDGLNRFDGTSFKVYRHEPGNSNDLGVNHVTSLHESKDGYIWIGTNGGGLSVYDRAKDSVLNYNTYGPAGISTVVNTVKGDNQQQIWVCTYGAVNIIDPVTKKIVNNSRYEKLLKEVRGKISMCFLQDSRQRVWIGTTEGLYMYDPAKNSIKLFTNQPADINSLPQNGVVKMVEDKKGNIWAATENGLAMLLPDMTGFRVYKAGAPLYQLSHNTISSLAVDNKNRLWIGTEEGLDVLDIATNQLTNYSPDKRNPGSISTLPIRSLFISKQGIYWVGTFRGGLNKYDENANDFHRKEYNAFDPQGLRSPQVTSFAAWQNDVFVGTDGGGLHLYHRNTGLLDYINLPVPVKNDKHDLSILSLEKSSDGQIWAGTFSNGIFKYNPATKSHQHITKGEGPTNLNSPDIFCLKEDSKGNMWVGTNGGGLNVIKAGTGEVTTYVHTEANPEDAGRPSGNYIRCIAEASDGRIWVGSFGAGISVLDPATQQFRFYWKSNSGLPSDYIITILEDRAGNIWVGTGGNGIGLLKKGDTRFSILNEKDGLANAAINKIQEDASGNIWISTNSGLSMYTPSTKKFKNYAAYDGLQAGAFVPGSGIALPDGELFFGGQKGFNHFKPTSFTLNKNSPLIAFTGLKIDNQAVTPSPDGPITQSIQIAEKIELGYKQAFSIGFAALNFTVPEATQYEYQLEGLDKNWVSAGKEHSAYYANIPPGKYIFRVRASNNDGLWSKENASIQIIVAPPFWRTIYAYIFYLFVLAGILFYLRRAGIKKIQMRFALEQERQQARQQIERQKKEAEYLRNLDQLKIKFLTNLSHEFRTPISLIMGPVDTLLAQSGEKPSNQLNLIKRNSRRLLNLVNQLLDFRKMEEGELKLQLTEGDIILFVKEVFDSFNDLAQRKQIVYDFACNAGSINGLFDYNKIERVLFNLLSNAFKFTPEKGHITVELTEVTSQDPTKSSVIVSIKDSGIGIPPQALSHVFDSFFQHATGTEIMNHGTGIGLSITKEFVELHGGEIWVESSVGTGSKFSFKLTLQKSNRSKPGTVTAPTVAEENITTADHRASILVIDDDDDFRLYLKEGLKNHYRVLEAPNGKEGWQRCLFYHPDIIVCDIQMPVMNGHELVQKIKSDKRTKHIPVILLTAANTPAGVLDGLETGAIDYITKPFDFAILHAKINNILVLNQSFKETYSKQVTVALPETESVSAKEKFLQNTLSFIYENLSNPELSVETLSNHLYMSRASLYNKILEHTGKTPVELIRSVKIEKAKELLEKKELSVNEIAYELGFANPNYFTKVFKSQLNKTPSEYQSKIKKELSKAQ